MAGNNRRRISKFPTDNRPPPPSPAISFDHHGRDSDASLCSSRPSSVGAGAGNPRQSSALINDRSSQAAALRSINSYLSSLSAPFSLRHPYPSAKDISEAFRFLLARLDFPIDNLDDRLLLFLRLLRCPIKLSKSALKAPGTPHSWPALLSVLYWLVQLALVSDHLAATTNNSSSNDHNNSNNENDLLHFVTKSYSLFISGNDDDVAELDEEYLGKAQRQAEIAAGEIAGLEKEVAELEEKVKGLKIQPSRKELLEQEKRDLIEDVKKFQAVVDSFGGKVAAMEGLIVEREKELEAKEKESRRLCEENEELQKKVDSQAVSVRDADRMKRELQAVERDILEAESGRNMHEEKLWELEADLGRKVNEIEVFMEECNKAIRRLKLGNNFQYVLNPKGSSPAEVIGVNYKTVLKPALNALMEDTKKAHMSKLEESITLKEQIHRNTKVMEEKRDRLAAFQAKLSEAEIRLDSIKNEMKEHASTCVAEAEKATQELAQREQEMAIVEKEARQFYENSEKELQTAIQEADDEVQGCASELLALIDSVSEYKEFMESTVSGMKTDLTGVVETVASLSGKLVSAGSNLSHCGLKRARQP